MSASGTEFTGSWILLSVVTDGGTASETEEFVGRIIEGPNISNEYEAAETNFKDADTTTRTRTHRTGDLEVTLAQEEGLPALETLGLQDTVENDREMQRPNEVPLIRIRYYRQKPDPANPATGLAQGKELERVEFAISADNAEAAEHANHELTGFINGDTFNTLRLPA